MTISQRIMTTVLIASVIATICAFRMVHVYPGRPLPISEVVGALGALAVSVPFVWMKRFTTLEGVAALAVPCISWGAIALILWATGEPILAALAGLLFGWFAFDWVKASRGARKHHGNGKSGISSAE